MKLKRPIGISSFYTRGMFERKYEILPKDAFQKPLAMVFFHHGFGFCTAGLLSFIDPGGISVLDKAG